MPENLRLTDFLDPVHPGDWSRDMGYKDGQVGKKIVLYDEEFPDFSEADLVLVGVPEDSGYSILKNVPNGPNCIREEFYRLFQWHSDIKLGDAGNIRMGETRTDTYAALKTVISEFHDLGKTVIILGGMHDLTLGQYRMYSAKRMLAEATIVDALIDLNIDSLDKSTNFLMEMLTSEPNYIKHYNHIGFQSYFVHPHMLETMDKLRFDCFRVGHVKENIEEMEPVIRNSHMFSFDISAIANSFAPANELSPNGFTGEESCILMRYAGLSPNISTVGIYGYKPEKDQFNLTAKQISHMLWYFIDGKSRGRRESKLEDKESFVEYHTAFAEVQTTFLQSKRTNRWWMQLPDKKYIACSYHDYLMASSNEIPERWLRAQERD